MNFSKFSCLAMGILVMYAHTAFSQQPDKYQELPLNDLDAFINPQDNWVIAGDAVADITRPMDLKPVKGQAAVVNVSSKSSRMDLVTKEAFGDIALQLDFMVSKNAASIVYLESRYALQLSDSWEKTGSGSGYSGTIITGRNKERGIFVPKPPLMNVARAPGLWQHLSLKFHAPRFDEKGMKTTNARFDEVYLNGVLIQQQVSVADPFSSALTDEKPEGSLSFSGDQGPVAYKNIRIKPLSPADSTYQQASKINEHEAVNPVTIDAAARPYLLRSFVNNGNKKLTHVLSLGHPAELNFSYDIKQGAIFQVWRGKFMDVTQMWVDRGEEQLAIPLGSVTVLSDAPAIAVLSDEKNAWPDSVAFDDLTGHGYTLDSKRMPVFSYNIKGEEVRDSISVRENGEGISRTLTVESPLPGTWCRLAVSSSVIENTSGDLYAISGKSYYIRLDKKYKPLIRDFAKGQELLVKYDGRPVTYSIVW